VSEESPFSRPADVDSSFEPRPAAIPSERTDRRPASPAEEAAFRAPHDDAAFDPRPGDRLPPRHGVLA
jgi:hypothetical protein